MSQQTDKALDYPRPENAPLAYYDCKTSGIPHTARNLFWAGKWSEDGFYQDTKGDILVCESTWGWHCAEEIQLNGLTDSGISLHQFLQTQATTLQTKMPHYLGIALQHACDNVEKKNMPPRAALGKALSSLPSEVKGEIVHILHEVLKMDYIDGEIEYQQDPNFPNGILGTIGDYTIQIRPSGNTDFYWTTSHRENGVLDEGWATTQTAAKEAAEKSLYTR